MIDRHIRTLQADGRNGRGLLKKNLHLTKVIKPAKGLSKWDLKFNCNNYVSITDSFALLAMEAFDSVAKMEAYAEEAATFQALAPKKSKSVKVAKEKAIKMTGPAAQFLNLPAV